MSTNQIKFNWSYHSITYGFDCTTVSKLIDFYGTCNQEYTFRGYRVNKELNRYIKLLLALMAGYPNVGSK